MKCNIFFFFFFSSRRRHTRFSRDWSSDVCSSDLGMWEVQGNVVRDLANLNQIETLPWDSWGLIPSHYDRLEPADVELLDRVAAVSAAGGPLRQAADAYRSDPRLAVPAQFAD